MTAPVPKKRTPRNKTTSTAVKHQIKLEVSGKALEPGPVTVTPTVVAQKDGKVSVFDEIKKYYKGIIAFIGTLLMVITEATPWLNTLLTDPEDKRIFTIVVGAITTLGVFLKDNEKWVDKLPD